MTLDITFCLPSHYKPKTFAIGYLPNDRNNSDDIDFNFFLWLCIGPRIANITPPPKVIESPHSTYPYYSR